MVSRIDIGAETGTMRMRASCPSAQLRREICWISAAERPLTMKKISDRIPAGNPDWSGDEPDPGTSRAPYKIYNIGNNQPVELQHYLACIEKSLGITAQKELLPMQPGDVPATFADVDDLMRDVGVRPATKIEDGIQRFVDWYRSYH